MNKYVYSNFNNYRNRNFTCSKYVNIPFKVKSLGGSGSCEFCPGCNFPFNEKKRFYPCYHILCKNCSNECIEENNCLLCGEEIVECEYLLQVDKVFLCPFKKCRKGFVNEKGCQLHIYYKHKLLEVEKDSHTGRKHKKEKGTINKDTCYDEKIDTAMYSSEKQIHEPFDPNNNNHIEYNEKDVYVNYYTNNIHNTINNNIKYDNKYNKYNKYKYNEEEQMQMKSQYQSQVYDPIELNSDIEEKTVYYENAAASKKNNITKFEFKNPMIFRESENFEDKRFRNKWGNKFYEEPEEGEYLNTRNRRKEHRYGNELYSENRDYKEKKEKFENEKIYERNKEGKGMYEQNYNINTQKGGVHVASSMYNSKKPSFSEHKYLHAPVTTDPNTFLGNTKSRKIDERTFQEEPKCVEPKNVNIPKYVQIPKPTAPITNINSSEPWIYPKTTFKSDYTKFNTGVMSGISSNKRPIQNSENNSSKKKEPTTEMQKEDDYDDLEDLM